MNIYTCIGLALLFAILIGEELKYARQQRENLVDPILDKAKRLEEARQRVWARKV